MNPLASHDIPSRLVGFDDVGETFQSGGRVYRGIYPGHAGKVRATLQKCAAHNLLGNEIVGTRELESDPFPGLEYEAVLEHDRVPFVTYAHEWPASMLHAAALFHVELFQQLGELGLALKDWHPYNILFDGTQPVFVDFTSIIPAAELASQGYLSGATAPSGFGRLWDDTSIALYQMYRLTYEPYFGLPLAMMADGRHAEARRRLADTALNASDSGMLRGEVFQGNLAGRARYELADRRLRLALCERGPVKRRFFAALESQLRSMRVAVSGSAYSSYYEDKREAFSSEPSPEWTDKQRAVHAAVSQFKPATVLDIGSNTGWFSMLAAGLGSRVVGVDLDEACIDSLFDSASRRRLPVLPLVANLMSPLPDRFARVFPGEPSLSKIGGTSPLYPSAEKRLSCEMVLALALVHHLALGQGLTFERIAAIFAGLSTRYLCVEFVHLDDRMIVDDPAFFPAMHSSPRNFDWYSLEGFKAALGEYFQEIQVTASYPSTRVMLLCTKK